MFAFYTKTFMNSARTNIKYSMKQKQVTVKTLRQLTGNYPEFRLLRFCTLYCICHTIHKRHCCKTKDATDSQCIIIFYSICF